MRYTTLFLFLFLISTATATPTLNFQHNETQPGETILATITTTEKFTKQIEPSDIKFFEGRKQVSFEFDITFHDDKHYLYIYTTREGNFSIQVENILYRQNGILQSKTIEENIIIKTTNPEETLSIKPGFVFTLGIPTINLINTGNSTLNITYEETAIFLQPQATQKITITPKEVFSKLSISSYKDFFIPIIYPPANASFISPSTQLDLRQNPKVMIAELLTNTETKKTIQLFNFGEDNLTDIQTTLNIPFVEITRLEDMPPRGVQNLTLIINPENPGHFEEFINITYTQNEKQNTLLIQLSLFILPEGSSPEDFEIAEETCEEISGTICTTKEICEGEATFTKKGEYCCLGTCRATESESESGNFGWLIGIIIFIILGGTGYYFYRKQKKTNPKNPDEQIKETSNKYTKRIAGGLTKS